jgi:hypothetical protein
MMADVEEQARAHLGIPHEVSGRETSRGDLGHYPGVLRRIGDGDHAAGALSLPRPLPSANMCLVTNMTDDPAGSMADRPAGGGCTAVLVVDMTAVPSWWDQGREKPGAVALAECLALTCAEKWQFPVLTPSRAFTRAPNGSDSASLTYLRAQASNLGALITRSAVCCSDNQGLCQQ